MIASFALAGLSGGPTSSFAAEKAQRLTEADFPYPISVSTWVSDGGFPEGDQIVITRVKGDRPRLEPLGNYLVEGVYTFNSAPQAVLALSLTSSGPSGRTSWSPRQLNRIDRGSGSFILMATMHAKGQFHVSFYPANGGSSQGGIYFRQQ